MFNAQELITLNLIIIIVTIKRIKKRYISSELILCTDLVLKLMLKFLIAHYKHVAALRAVV